MEITHEKNGEILIISVSGMLDASNYQTLDEFVQGHITAGACSFIFNLEDLEYMSSAGVRVFIKTYRTLASGKGMIAFSNLQPFVLEIFDIAGLSGRFQIYPDNESAMQALSI
jgi:anti-sigma B factor antagonist